MFHAKFGVNYTPYRLQCGMKTAQLLAQSLLFGTLAAPSFGTSGALFRMKAGCYFLAQLLAAQSEDQ